jgi:hypothetical protein
MSSTNDCQGMAKLVCGEELQVTCRVTENILPISFMCTSHIVLDVKRQENTFIFSLIILYLKHMEYGYTGEN